MEDPPGARFQELGQKVEASRLAGTVRPDETVDRALGDTQVDIGNRDESLELLGQRLRFDDIRHALTMPSSDACPRAGGSRRKRGARSHATHRDSVQLAFCACAVVDTNAARATAAKPVLVTFITP
jgi:hypothetical protein